MLKSPVRQSHTSWYFRVSFTAAEAKDSFPWNVCLLLTPTACRWCSYINLTCFFITGFFIFIFTGSVSTKNLVPSGNHSTNPTGELKEVQAADFQPSRTQKGVSAGQGHEDGIPAGVNHEPGSQIPVASVKGWPCWPREAVAPCMNIFPAWQRVKTR